MPGMPSRVGGIYGSYLGGWARDLRKPSGLSVALFGDVAVRKVTRSSSKHESPQLDLLNEWQNAVRVVNCRLNIAVQ